MWQTTRTSDSAPQELAADLAQLRHGSLQRLILSSAGLYLLMQLALSATWPALFGWPIVPVVGVVAVSTGLAFILLNRHAGVAQFIWHGGLTVSICLAAYTFQRPEPLLVLAFQPFFVVVTAGWRIGAGAWLFLAIGAIYLLERNLLDGFTQAYALVIIFTGAFGVVLGWAAIGSLVTLVQWLSNADQQSRRNLEDARQHRSKLLQAVKELDQANYRLVRINAALDTARQTAEEALRFKAEFVANVSHELRTPLNLIIGFSEVMILSPESYGGQQLPGAYRADINAIYSNAKHLAALVDDVLDLGRIEAGKLAFNRQPVGVQDLLGEVDSLICDYLSAKGLTFEQHIAPALPTLPIDRVRIRQVLLNLLVNAVRFTDAGVVRLEVVQIQDVVRFSVADSGRGIAADELPHIFEPFHTSGAEGSSRWLDGKGLGLPISKKYVEMHGGEIGVRSIPGRGSTFWFTLPLTAPAAETKALSASPIYEAQAATEKLLVVYPHSSVMAPLLQREFAGCRIEFAPSADAACRMGTDLGALAIITDDLETLRMKQAYAEASARIPVIAFAWSDEADAILPIPGGAERLLTKPIEAENLLALYDEMGADAQRILIADENPDIVRLLRRILRARVPATGLLEAYTGEETLQRLVDDAPNLALIDLALCDADGQPILHHPIETSLKHQCRIVAISPPPPLLSTPKQRTVTVQLPNAVATEQLAHLLHSICAALGDVPTAMPPKLPAMPPG